MERKMNIAEFSALVGTTSKTIYGKINNNGNLPVNEQLKTVKEKVKGREVTLIITNDEQIELYKNRLALYLILFNFATVFLSNVSVLVNALIASIEIFLALYFFRILISFSIKEAKVSA